MTAPNTATRSGVQSASTIPTLGPLAATAGIALGVLASLAAKPAAATAPTVGPWIGIGIIVLLLAVPFASQRRRGVFDPFTPTTFPVWSYLGPVFIGGSLLLLSGLARHPMSPGLIPEPVTLYYSLALYYVAIGWYGLVLGFYSGLGAGLGEHLRDRLPRVRWETTEMRWPSALLLVAGISLYWIAYRNGLVGYQRMSSMGRFGALLIYSTWLARLGCFLLWLSLFSRRDWSNLERLLCTLLILLGPLYLVVSASRAALFSYLLIVACAFRFSGRRITAKHIIIFCVLSITSVGLGSLWATTYRQIKGDETPLVALAEENSSPDAIGHTSSTLPPHKPRASALARRQKTLRPPLATADPTAVRVKNTNVRSIEVLLETQNAPATTDGAKNEKPPQAPFVDTRNPPQRPRSPQRELVSETVQEAANRSLSETVGFVFQSLGARIEITSSVAVVTANYERLREREEEVGIADNIWRDTWTALIPRAFWPEKPAVSDARTYSALYFKYGQSSFAITPMADLLRNFGPIGIPLGMAFLGLALRIFHQSLVAMDSVPAANAALFSLILLAISYEGFFGSILPVVLRLGVITVGGLTIVHLAVLAQRRLGLTAPSLDDE